MSLAHGVLLPAFSGTTLPGWVAEALRDGLAGVTLFAENTPDVATTRALTDEVRLASPGAVVASDEEGGDVTRIQAAEGSSIPGNAALGAVDDEALTREVAAAYGRLIALSGIDLALGPSLDVASEPKNPVIGVRSFSADPTSVARHGAAFAAGLADAGVASCSKHFPGHGSTLLDSHLALPVLDVDEATLRSRDLEPFARVATDAVMTAHVVVPFMGDLPASLSTWAYDAIRDLGHSGPILTDALDMKAIADRYGMGEASVLALEAGADLLILGSPYRDAHADFVAALSAIERALAEGRLDPDRLRESAERNRTLQRTTRPEASEGAFAAAVEAVDDVGLRAARAAVVTRGDVTVTGRPVLVDLRRRLNHASGRFGGALLSALQDATPAEAITVDDVLAHADDAVVVLTREPLADAEEAAALASVLAARPDAVVVHCGIAAAAPDAERLVLAHGVGRANAAAAVEAMGLS